VLDLEEDLNSMEDWVPLLSDILEEGADDDS